MSVLMSIKRIAKQGITHPFGDSRSVKQAFPKAIGPKDSDPFLMCDYFDVEESKGKARHEDEFPVDWHPHRGFDIASYLKTGTGRHGDSLGNRETFDTPGMQWMSTGSGVVHAEGGANEKGVFVQGFQIWINVPAKKKMDDPRYGTVPTKDLPFVTINNDNPNAHARVLAGDAFGVTGPFQTTQPVQMIDFELSGQTNAVFDIAQGLDTAMLYVYEGSFESINSNNGGVENGHVVLFDADDENARQIDLVSSKDGGKALLFAGKKLKEPIAWHGPIVMNTDEEIDTTLYELRSGRFPPKRVEWDYKKLAAFPK